MPLSVVMDDGVLLEAATVDRAAFGALFDRHAPAIYELIPLRGDSAKLLEIRPERTPRVVERTIDQIKSPPS